MPARTLKRQRARKPGGPLKTDASPPWMLLAASALASLFPLFAFWRQWNQLFFFHDDFLLLHELSGSSLPRWIVHPFAGESIVPLFKLLWIAAVWVSGGSYLSLIVLQWLTHCAICFTLGWLLIRLRLDPLAAAFAVITFGLPSSNIETLAWSMQWCSQLSLLFFLLAWHALLTILDRRAGAWHVWYGAALVASALCSSRGIVVGVVLALYVVLAGEGRRRLWLAAASLAPAALLMLATWLFVPPFRETQVGHFAYSLSYLAMNPFYALIPWRPASPALVFGALKLLVVGLAFYLSSRRLRLFFLALLAFDLATAAALGYARTWTGLSTTVSSRYQYIPLLTLAPMCGVLVGRLFHRERAATETKGAGQTAWKALLFLLWIWLLVYRWGGAADTWSTWRGTQIRNALARNRPSAAFDPSRLTTAEGRRLVEQYQLH